jgi:hypothetical protein
LLSLSLSLSLDRSSGLETNGGRTAQMGEVAWSVSRLFAKIRLRLVSNFPPSARAAFLVVFSSNSRDCQPAISHSI